MRKEQFIADGWVILTDKREKRELLHSPSSLSRKMISNWKKGRTSMMKRKLEPRIEKAILRKHLAL